MLQLRADFYRSMWSKYLVGVKKFEGFKISSPVGAFRYMFNGGSIK